MDEHHLSHSGSSLEHSDSSSSSGDQPTHSPTPLRPKMPSRKSSGTLIVPRDSDAVGPVEMRIDPGDVRAMSPRRTSQDIEMLGRETRNELRRCATAQQWENRLEANDGDRHAKALQDSLLTIFNRIEAVKEEHDKLDNHNKFLQKYIGDLMSTSKITASSSGSRSKK